jgi:uncharacterized paraquat-inducible protein A
MPTCPTCGSTGLPCPVCGADSDSQIASWIEAVPTPDEMPTERRATACTACGYSGEMFRDGRGTRCPACDVVVPGRRADVTLRVTRTIDCPECGRIIGVTAEDEGKTVICPGCSYFLGTPLQKPGAGRLRGRRSSAQE